MPLPRFTVLYEHPAWAHSDLIVVSERGWLERPAPGRDLFISPLVGGIARDPFIERSDRAIRRFDDADPLVKFAGKALLRGYVRALRVGRSAAL